MINISEIISWLLETAWKVFVVAAAISVLAFPLMMCWNSTMPFLFALPVIDWNKSFCILVLFNVLFARAVVS
jgi:hypothetical protein